MNTNKPAWNSKPLVAGTAYGQLTVVEDNNPKAVKVLCVCGVSALKDRNGIRSGHISSCGCAATKHARELGLSRAKLPGQREFGVWYSAYERRAKKRGMPFELTREHFLELTSQPCYYCGRSPAKGKIFQRNGIDRVDSSKGYAVDNTVSCCEFCNRAKSDVSEAEFSEWLNQLRGEEPFRPQGWVALERIVDGFGKEISYEQAIKYGWLTPSYETGKLYTLNDEGKEVGQPNLFLDQGRQVVAYAFGFRSPVSDYTVQKFGVGTGITPAKVTDVALQAPVTLNTGTTTKAIDSVDFLSPFVVRVAFTLASDDANGYILSEMGLFSGGGALIARKVRSVSINKTSDFSPTLTWRIRF